MGMQDTRSRVGEKQINLYAFVGAGTNQELVPAPANGNRLLITRIVARPKAGTADTITLKSASTREWPLWDLTTTDGWDDMNLLCGVNENFNGTWSDVTGMEFKIFYSEVGPNHNLHN